MRFGTTSFIVAASLLQAVALIPALSFSSSALGGQGKNREKKDADWSVSLTGRGGELDKTVVKTTVEVRAGDAKGIETRTSKGHRPETREVSIPAAAATRLEKTMEELKAWDLPDFSKEVLDQPDYTIQLKRAGKTHTIDVKGASKSDAHLKLILAIQHCFEKGAPR